ncbi:hypothetical protein [Taibaiella koreensis]|uniref:hypothetical protein n=1 Tax=Taibaiella koreensis TaxID=1268548 RepID=UPI000E59CFCB|nr:hypothetical protein [Taibaiella koreensis]
MNLQQFLNFYEIKPDSLEAIKKRAFIVGRFNTSEAETSAYLFSKSRRKDPRYKDCRDLSYASFIDVIKPTLTESYESGEEIATGQHLPYFELSPQTTDRSKGDASYVIDPYNYFFQRAISTSEHEHYKQNTENLSSKLPENTAGETIYKEIRLNLKKFCSFQSKNYELIRAFSQLLHSNRGKGGIPGAFADGEVLPVKFLPVFIDFLYREGTDPFVADSVDFESQQIWKPTMTGPKKEMFLTNFSKLVSVFKNYLIDPKGLARERIENIDLRPLATIVNQDLQKAFVASRDSYNMLRQIIRSKVLLSMVLQWATNSFHQLESVKHEVTASRKNIAIEKAIKDGTDGLAKPARNLSNGKPVAEMIADFRENFPKIIEYVNNPEDAAVKEVFSKLSDFLQNIANRILENEDKTSNIRLVMTMHPDQKRATLQALENYFVDVLIPRMFKEPGLTLDELKRKFNSYEAILLQQSSLMDVANTDSLDSLDAKENESYDETFARVMNAMVEVLVDDNVVASIIRTAQTAENQVLQRTLLPASNGIGQMVPLLSPVENASTAAFGQSIEEPVGDEIIAVMELERPETIKRLREAFPESSAAAQGGSGMLSSGTAGRLLVSGEETEETQLPANIQEQERFLELKNSALARLAQSGNVNLGLALQQYAHAGDAGSKALALQEVRTIIHQDVKIYHYNLSRIYDKYVAPTALTNFKNTVEAMTLSQLLLVHQNELHLDKAGTNLFDLLLDMIEYIDNPERPDLKKFFSEHSLTKYVSEKHFNHNGRGFAALEAGLKNQTEKSLNNVKQYVSELQGVKYLLDVLEKSQADCEVVVINAHWYEFLNWVKANIDDVEKSILNPAGLTKHNSSNPQFPVIAYMTELSFNNEGYDNTISQKMNFLNELGNGFNNAGNGAGSSNVAIMPPICISTSVAGGKEWVDSGISLSELCRNVASPVLILGPSVPLNSKADMGFETTLASGYLLCTHLLNDGKTQYIDLKHVNALSSDRFRVIGYGAFGISNSIKNLIEAPDAFDYSFAADFYLYIVALLAAAAGYSGKAADYKQLDISGLDFWQAFYNCFNYNAIFQPKHAESKVLDKISLYKKVTDWSLENDISGGADLQSVQLFLNERKDKFQVFNNIGWFNNLVNSLKINKQAPVSN